MIINVTFLSISDDDDDDDDYDYEYDDYYNNDDMI
jgi:hypothetical protein